MKQQKSMQELWQDSYLSGGNDAYLEELYETYLKDPECCRHPNGRIILQVVNNQQVMYHMQTFVIILQISQKPARNHQRHER